MATDRVRFHQATVDLHPAPFPVHSPKAADFLVERERRLGIHLPPAVKEWYSFDGAVGLLEKYSNDDVPTKLEELGAPVANWYGGGPRDFERDGLLLILQENQGVCCWAVKLGGAEDPEVVIEVDTA